MTQPESESIQQFYSQIQLDLEVLTESSEKFDSSISKITPLTSHLLDHIDLMLDRLKARGNPPFARRLTRFRAMVASFEKRYKYDSLEMEMMFRSLRLLSEHAPAEIVSKDLLVELKEYFQEQATPVNELTNKKTLRSSRRFLMLRNGQMYFLAEFKKRLAQSSMKVLKPMNYPDKDLQIFFPAGDSAEFTTGEKTVVLYEDKKSNSKAIAADDVEGIIYLKPKLLSSQIKYLNEEDKKTAHIILKGRRYYFIGE